MTFETFVVLRGRMVEEFYYGIDRICCANYEIATGWPVSVRPVHGICFVFFRVVQLFLR